MKTFYFHDVLQDLNHSEIQKSQLLAYSHYELFASSMKPFEGRKDIKVILLIVADGIENHQDVVDYIKDHPEWEIGCHGLHHEDYSLKTKDDALADLTLAKQKIEETFGRVVTVFVPPWKKYNAETAEVCKELGLIIELENYFPIKHLNFWKVEKIERFDIHHWLPCDRRKIKALFQYLAGEIELPRTRHSAYFGNEEIEAGSRYWNRAWKRNYVVGVRKHKPLYDAVKKHLNGKIADLACGVTSLYSGGNYDVTGIDISEFAIQKSKEYYPTGNFMVGNIIDTKLPDNAFDTTLLTSILEHFFDFTPILKEAKRITKVGGKIIISVPVESYYDDHIHPIWDEKKIEKDIGGFLGEVSFYRVQKWWVVIYEKI